MGISMSEQKTILVIDDDKAINQLLVNSLSFKYQADAVESGAAAIEYCKTKKPHAILLDLNLGDYDGREVCQVLKREFGEKTPPIVFISGDKDEENIISCFDNGADDFIAKPFSAEQVVRKVDALLRYDVLINNLKVQSTELSELVTTTMSQASSYGAVLQMVKNLNYCDSEQEIAESVFKFLAGQGLHAAIYFINSNSSSCFDQKARICSPIVKEVFELAHNKKRLHKLGSRLLTSDEHCSLLIMNPPEESSEEYGVFIDVVAVIIEALEARYLGYLRERELGILHTELSGVIHELHESVEDVRSKKQKLIDDIVLRISLSFHQLDLSEEQEDFFSKMLEDTVMTHDDNNSVIMSLQHRLNILVSDINELVKPRKAQEVEVEVDDIQLF